MKYNKKMFLEYASAFDYTEDFHYSAEQSGKPITWEQAKKQNDEYMKSMENWSLKDFQKHFDFRKFDIDENEQANDNYKEKMKTFEVIVSKRVRFKTTVKAENEEQAKDIAKSNDSNLDYEDITHNYEELWLDDIYEDEE